MRNKKGFTLMELLVVLTIIVLLVTMLLPTIINSMEKSRQLKCKSNLRQIATAIIAFADDHGGRLPGCYGNACGDSNDREWTWEYIGKEVLIPEASGSWLNNANHVGTLVEYLPISEKNAGKIYRCPSLSQGELGSGEGSNGMFDYTMVKAFAGGMISRIPSRAILNRNESDRERELATPLVVEESPNTINGSNIAPGFSGSDQVGSWHADGKGFYCGIGGGVVEVQPGKSQPPATAEDFEVRFANEWHPINNDNIPFGELPW